MGPREGSIPELVVGMVLGQARRQIRYLLLKLSLATHSIIDISACHPEPGHYCRPPGLSLVKPCIPSSDWSNLSSPASLLSPSGITCAPWLLLCREVKRRDVKVFNSIKRWGENWIKVLSFGWLCSGLQIYKPQYWMSHCAGTGAGGKGPFNGHVKNRGQKQRLKGTRQ